jgi:hypothetical protein
MESTDIRQIEALLQAQLENIAEESDRIRLVAMVDDYFSLLKRAQSLPVLQRLYFFDCVYVVFCYLHLKGQLRRHKEQFDEACVNDLNQMFKRLYERI